MERVAGCRFTAIGAPQPAEIFGAAGKDATRCVNCPQLATRLPMYPAINHHETILLDSSVGTMPPSHQTMPSPAPHRFLSAVPEEILPYFTKAAEVGCLHPCSFPPRLSCPLTAMTTANFVARC